MASRPVRGSCGVRGLGLVVALLALACQLALGAIVLPDAAAPGELAALDALGVLCAGPPAPDDGGPARHRHHAADLTLCPAAVAVAQPAAILTPSPAALAVPAATLVLRDRERPPGRGPPPPTARVGAPRAPPALA